MARESQGLQVLLIVFVMLTVVLGVTTYLYNKRADEATKAAVAADNREKQAKDAMADKQKECDLLKKLIGFPERTTEEIEKQCAEDMQTYANAKKSDAGTDKPLFAQDTLFYSRLLAGMFKTIQERDGELIQSRALVADLQTRFKDREKSKDDAIAALTAGYGKAEEQVKKSLVVFDTGQQATADESKRNLEMLTKVRDEVKTREAEAERVQKLAVKAVQDKEAEVRAAAKTLNQVSRPQMDVPSGEITWVSLPQKMVWINRGRADALQRQTKFTVYSGESVGPTAVKKGTVEVTRIEGDHSAQARIIDDKLADPIMAGDKVFTPLWSPGQLNHFALTGIMNLDGDGRNQLNVVRGMINNSGGAVDCELDERGQKQGQITAETRVILIGDAPDKSSADFIKNHGVILGDAERYSLRKMTLAEFKTQMNYQKSSSVEHFGNSLPGGDAPRPAPKAPKADKADKAAKAPAASDDTAK